MKSPAGESRACPVSGYLDHLDDDGSALGAFYEKRLRLVELIEWAGFDGYHLAEDDATPLGLASSPGVSEL